MARVINGLISIRTISEDYSKNGRHREVYKFIPHLSKTVIEHVVQLMLELKVMDYQPYMDLTAEKQAFRHDLAKAMQLNLKYCIKRGHDYYNAKAASTVYYRCG